jgi:SAM-dependent methyltransferase
MSGFSTEQNIEYWNERALKYEKTGQATLLDDNMRRLEIETVQRWLEPNSNVLEVFCGNGSSTLEFARFCNSIVACDLSENMINLARRYLCEEKNRCKNVLFEKNDILEIDKAYALGRFDTVVSVRGLINLPSWELQKEAILKIHKLLPDGGKFVFIEGSQEGFEAINDIRKIHSLPALKQPWYDRYFSASLLDTFMDDYFSINDEMKFDMYFLVSRVLYPISCFPKEPEFKSVCNTVARLLVSYAQTDLGTTLLIGKLYTKKGK